MSTTRPTSKLTLAALQPDGLGEAVQRALAAAIVESSEDGIVSKTLDGIIQSWNGGATRLFGYSAAEAIGKSITMLIPPELQAEEQLIIGRIREGKRIDHFDTVRIAKDGRRIPISLTISPVRDATGTIIGASKIVRDITERKRIELALQDRERELQEADRRKDEFLALLAHELRNPLAPIRYALAATRKPNVTHEQRARAEEVIERQVTHMSRLLDDLLDVSRITWGTLELKKSHTELTSILGSAIEAARPILDDKGHILTLDLPDAPVRVDADPVRLAQVFSNLLINAAKYTDRGGRIWLKARREAQDIVVSVRDNGIGITKEMMPKLFSMFTQSRDAIGRSEGGLGVGLSLVDGLVKLHGGSVQAQSNGPQQGSEFIVRMPVGTPTSASDLTFPAAESTVARGLRILVVDDNRDAADTFKTFLELSGHSVHVAPTGIQALVLAELHRPQIMLLDIGLPDLNGYQLAAKIRAMPWASDAMLVAITGFGQEEDRRRALAAGFDEHLTKPIDPTALEPLLKSLAESC